MQVANPLFRAGARINVRRTQFQGSGGPYEVIRALPPEGGRIRYRIKSSAEAFERIVDEANVEGISHD